METRCGAVIRITKMTIIAHLGRPRRVAPAPAASRFGQAVPFERSHALLWSASRRDDPEIKWLRDRLRPLVASRVAGFRAGEPAAKRAG